MGVPIKDATIIVRGEGEKICFQLSNFHYETFIQRYNHIINIFIYRIIKQIQ